MKANKLSNKTKQRTASPLPMKMGVSASRVWLPKVGDYKNATEKYDTWATMLDFLLERFPFISEDILRERMLRGEIVTESGAQILPDSPFQAEIFLFYYREVPDEIKVPFKEEVLFKDNNIIVVDKPHFVPVSPSGRYVKETLLSRLKHHYQNEEISPIHRLDRETAGVILFSCNPEIRGAYQHLFQQRKVKKMYEAIAPLSNNEFPFTYRSRITAHNEIFFLMTEEEGEENSETLLEIAEVKGDLAKYHLSPVTGRQHQLRVHMSALGCPILNDQFYPELKAAKGDDFSQPLQLLAKRIEFIDPISNEVRVFTSKQDLKLPE